MAFRLVEVDTKFFLEIENVGAGHDVPTGDLFREIRIEERQKGTSRFQLTSAIGRNSYFKFEKGRGVLRWKQNNAIKPFEIRRIPIPEGTAAVQVSYYYEGELPGLDLLKGTALAHEVMFEAKVPEKRSLTAISSNH